MKKLIFALIISLAIVRTSYAASDTIFMQTYEEDGKLTVEVEALDMTTPVIGMAFDLYYDPYALSYQSYEEGLFFEQGGEPIYMVAEDIDAKGKKIISGITLKRTDQQVSAGNTIITFYFDILKRENTKLEFDHTVVSTLQEGERLDLTNVGWTNTEISLETQQTNEEIARTAIPNQEVVSGTGSVETTEEKPENVFYANILSLETVAVGLFPIAFGLCYILWRFLKKKYAKKIDIGITEPEEKKSVQGTWTEI